MATKMAPGFGPIEMTDGYSMSGSQAKSVALKPGGTLSGGKRFSVAGPVSGCGSAPGRPASRRVEQLVNSRTRRVMAFMDLVPEAGTAWQQATLPGVGRRLQRFCRG